MIFDDLTIEMPFAVTREHEGPLVLSNPEQVFHARRPDEVAPALDGAQAAADDGCIVAGFVSYEAGRAFEAALHPAPPNDFPLLYLGAFRRTGVSLPTTRADYRLGPWTEEIEQAAYNRAIAAIKDEIAAGNVYQVNFTYRLHAEFQGDPYSWYRRLVQERHGAYSAFLAFGPYAIVSASPELFFRWEDGRIVTKPMKGTERRGFWPEDDHRRLQRLSESTKDRAENVMILDLMRNDIGRIARLGSVRVCDPFSIERLPTVFQMTSTVSGDLSPATTIRDIFVALFPGGSITGAPKISAMNIINRLEPSPRGVYCGAIGAIFPGRRAIFNIAIRTVTINRKSGIASLGVGGGITWDSVSASEYEETRTKLRFATERRPEFDLLETMRLEDGEFFLLDRHLRRLARSAEQFGFRLDLSNACTRLASQAESHPRGIWRVRLIVAQDGGIDVTCVPLTLNDRVQKVAICTLPIEIETPFVYHKTTHRAFYDDRKAMHPSAFDVLLMNSQGRYTEFTIGNLVIERGRRFLTPPVSEGLLPGTMREELLERCEIDECIITDDDLLTADRIWLINSVRKWVEVEIVANA